MKEDHIRVRLKENCPYVKMSTPYGIITHDWKEVPKNSSIYAEMEVEGKKEETVKEFNTKPSKKGFGKKKTN